MVLSTGYGISVPEGEYRVTVSYDAGDGPKKKY